MAEETWNRTAGGVTLIETLERYWWLFVLRGIAAIVFGVLSFYWPGITLLTLVLFYGAYALVDGIFALIAGIMGRTGMETRWWLILVGLLGILAGLATFAWPAITALVLLVFIASWAIATGVFQIVGAVRLRKDIDNEWLLASIGALSVLFGTAMLVRPAAGALALVWLIGVFSILHGVLLVGFGFNVWKYRGQIQLQPTTQGT